MATKVFEKALMASEDVQAYVGSCKFYNSNAYANVKDGAFVVLGNLDLDGVYSSTSIDYNIYKAAAPAAVTDEVVVVDLSAVQEGVIGGNNIKWGIKQVDLEAQAGYAARFRRLVKGDKFWLGQGNFASAPTVGKYAVLTANDVILTPADDKSANFCVKIQASKNLTIGQTVNKISGNYEQIYLVEVV